MKTGMHLLLLEKFKALGLDGVEVPIFNVESRAPYERLGKRLAGLLIQSSLADGRPRTKRSVTV
jgi:hypothetical protein